MNPPDNDILTFIKDWLWAPLLALIGWAWTRNQKEHDDLWEAHEKLQAGTSSGNSVLNDRIMDYVDTVTSDMKDQQRRTSDKATEHITKLFQNAEQDRKEFHKQISDLREDGFKRHIELMNAIHGESSK